MSGERRSCLDRDCSQYYQPEPSTLSLSPDLTNTLVKVTCNLRSRIDLGSALVNTKRTLVADLANIIGRCDWVDCNHNQSPPLSNKLHLPPHSSICPTQSIQLPKRRCSFCEPKNLACRPQECTAARLMSVPKGGWQLFLLHPMSVT